MRKLYYLLFLIVFLLPVKVQANALWVGETMTCDATSAVMGLTSDINWSVSGGYLSLSGSGFYRDVKVTQYFYGTATVTCTWKYRLYAQDTPRTQRKSWTISCNDNPVSISPTTMRLAVGETGRLRYSHRYNNDYTYAANPYYSTSSSCISVSSDGVVTALRPGTAYVNVYSKISADSPYCLVTVEKVDPTYVSIPSSLQSYVGEETLINATLYPSNAMSDISWYSRDSSVAAVSSSGSVKGMSEGVTYVYARTSNGLQSDDCKVTVSYRKPSSVSISKSTLYLPISQTFTLSASVAPSNAKYELTWSSDNKGVAEVSSSGIVTGKKAGTAVITVKTDNGYSAKCTVTVPPDPSEIIIPKKIAMLWNSKRTLAYEVKLANAYVQLRWTGSDTKVAQVSADGIVTAVGEGTAEIKVETQNGKSAVCKVEVDPPRHIFKVWMRGKEDMMINLSERPSLRYNDGSLLLDTKTSTVVLDTIDVHKFTFEDMTVDRMPTSIWMESNIELPYKTSKTLEYILYPADYDIQTSLTWESDKPEIVEVNKNGHITALAPGQATVTVTACNGTYATCHVTVPEPDHHLFVWLGEERYDAYSFSDKPKITHEGDPGEDGELVIDNAKGTYRYVNSDVLKITFSDTDTPKNDVTVSNKEIAEEYPESMDMEGDKVTMRGLTPFSDLYIYDMEGRIAGIKKASAEGDITINLLDLEKGIYILKSETITYKIIRK